MCIYHSRNRVLKYRPSIRGPLTFFEVPPASKCAAPIPTNLQNATSTDPEDSHGVGDAAIQNAAEHRLLDHVFKEQ